MKSVPLFVALLVGTIASTALAQSDVTNPANSVNLATTTVSDSPGDKTPSALFEEVNNFARKKFEAFEKLKMPYDDQLKQKIEREQRDLAAKYAGILAPRKLKAKDVYYLGMLYNLAGDSRNAFEAMRRYLKEDSAAAGEPAQNARAIVIINAARAGALAEAETRLQEYAADQPQVAEDRYALENWLTVGYFNAKDYEKALPHAQQLWIAAQSAAKERQSLSRDEMLKDAAVSLSEVNVKLNRKDEALAVVQDLRKLALQLPSGNLYKLALRRLVQIEPAIDLFRNVEELGVAGLTTPAEINASEWIDRTPVKLSELRGKVVLLDFWATWCGPCRATLPKFQKLYEQYKNQGFEVIGLSQFEGHAEGKQLTPAQELAYLREFKKRFGVTYGFGVLSTDGDYLNYSVSSIPTTFLIDRNGKVRFISIGSSDFEGAALNRMIRKLINEPAPVSTPATTINSSENLIEP